METIWSSITTAIGGAHQQHSALGQLGNHWHAQALCLSGRKLGISERRATAIGGAWGERSRHLLRETWYNSADVGSKSAGGYCPGGAKTGGFFMTRRGTDICIAQFEPLTHEVTAGRGTSSGPEETCGNLPPLPARMAETGLGKARRVSVARSIWRRCVPNDLLSAHQRQFASSAHPPPPQSAATCCSGRCCIPLVWMLQV